MYDTSARNRVLVLYTLYAFSCNIFRVAPTTFDQKFNQAPPPHLDVSISGTEKCQAK